MASLQRSQDWGWSCILQACMHDWSAQPETSFQAGGACLRVVAGGGWRCDTVVDAATVALLDTFLPLVASCRPWTVAQIGQSLDGRIATQSGASHYINGIEARTHLHRLRAVADAVVVGVGTLNADDPLLTVRHVSGPQPLRVVLDPSGRAAPQARMFADGSGACLLIRGEGAGEVRAEGQVRTLRLPTREGRFAPAEVVQALHAEGCRRVLVEGGGLTVSGFLEAGVLDRLHVLVAPMLIGSGRPGLSLPVIDTLEGALRPRCRYFACGDDVLFDLDFGDEGGI